MFAGYRHQPTKNHLTKTQSLRLRRLLRQSKFVTYRSEQIICCGAPFDVQDFPAGRIVDRPGTLVARTYRAAGMNDYANTTVC